MNKLLAAAILLVFINGLTACSLLKRRPLQKHAVVDTTGVSANATIPTRDSSRFIGPQPYNEAETPVNTNAAKKDLVAELAPLYHRQLSYSTFSGKAKMHYEGPDQKQEFTANFRIKKDSAIWVAITAFGGVVQVARALITPDSIFLVNYLEKEVTTMPLSQAAKSLPVPAEFSTLQNMIVGDALKNTGNITDATDFGGTWSIVVNDSGYAEQVAYNKSDSTMRSFQLSTTDPNGPQGVIQYGNYEIANGRNFATNRAINVVNNGKQYYLDMNFNNEEFDQPVDLPFTMPKNYTRK